MSFPLKPICTAILLAQLAVSAWAVTASPTDRPATPEDLRFEFHPVPVAENAIIEWRKAAGDKVALSEQDKKVIAYCWTPAAPKPADSDIDTLRSWLKRNQSALRIFDDSLKKSKAQWPERNPRNPQPEATSLDLLIKARLLEADLLAGEGKSAEATHSLEDSLKLAQWGIDGDPSLLRYFVAGRARTETQAAMVRLASRKTTRLDSLKKLLQDLPALDMETNAYAKVLRVEFSQDSADKPDIKHLAEIWSKASADNALRLLYPEDCYRPLRVLLDPLLVPLHPDPYDFNSDIIKTVRHFRIYLTNSVGAWTNRSETVDLEDETNHTQILADIQPLMTLLEHEPLPLSQSAAQKARSAYIKLHDPVGRILSCSLIHHAENDSRVFKYRTEREAARTLLALLIFERQKDRLPEKLDDLVEAKILMAVPTDPFSGNPLGYSRERRIIWSVSEDGTDDDGTAGAATWIGPDAVWPIPELK